MHSCRRREVDRCFSPLTGRSWETTPMSSKHLAPGAATASPLANALLVGTALVAGVAILVSRGRMSWPPNQLLASIFTVAGCLAAVGPIVMARSEASERGLGELLWMTGGLLVWVFDLVAL